ncbi:MAG: hypothetical protein RQ753_00785, partial [Desulfurivibrionaceae bacterium]|nr:hypothetical protein [Desulfurivibrionaceae bacterium]
KFIGPTRFFLMVNQGEDHKALLNPGRLPGGFGIMIWISSISGAADKKIFAVEPAPVNVQS